MYTETELREALQHSASRADALSTDRAAGVSHRTPISIAIEPSRRPKPRWLRVGLALAAAAAVVAAATVSALVTESGPHNNRAAAPPGHARPAPASVALDAAGAVDAVQVSGPGPVTYDIGGKGDVNRAGAAETVRGSFGTGDSVIEVDIVPSSSPGFDASRIPRTRSVHIAGTTGYYSLFKLYPLDANTRPGSDKFLRHWTIAFQTPAHYWVFAHLDKASPADDPNSTDVSVNDPAAIVAAYDRLGVSFTPDRSRIAFRAGYLPSGLTFAHANLQSDAPGAAFQVSWLSADGRSLDIDLRPNAHPADVHCIPGADCGITKSKEVGKYILEVTGRGYRAETVTRVLDTITVANLADPATFWTLSDALG